MATTVDAKLLKSTKFPPEFSQKVDMQKVNLEVMKKWIASKISDILGNEDDVVIELCFNLIEGSRYPNIKKLQIQLTGFLEKETPNFCQELWKLCLSAQNNPQGVPKELLEAKKLELIQEKIEAERAADEARQRRERDQRRDRDLDTIRNRERAERGRGRSYREPPGDNWRGGRSERDGRGGGRPYDRGVRDSNETISRRSRSPAPRRRDSREQRGFGGDSYIPYSRNTRRRDRERRRSPSISSRSRSRSRSVSRSPRRRRSLSDSRSPLPRHKTRSSSRSLSGSRGRNSHSYRGNGERDRERYSQRNSRRGSTSLSASSRSRSPESRKRRRSPSNSCSRSPLPHSQKRVSRRESLSRSRSASRSGHGRRATRASRTISPLPDDRDILRNSRKGRDRDERRLTRSNSRDHSQSPPRRQHSPSRSRSRSRGRRSQKRHRSIQRYAPAGRRRNTSSVSLPDDLRDARADISEDETADTARSVDPPETDPPQRANERREKLLRDRIKKMRASKY